MPAPFSISVSLNADQSEALRELSRAQCRHPRDQAKLFIVEALRRRGLLRRTPDPAPPAPEPPDVPR
jgi:hypothetical protein